jgi:hypothetical protein
MSQSLEDRMLDGMRSYQTGVSFVEFEGFCQSEGEDDYLLCVPGHENVVLWAGLSEDFIDSFNAVRRDHLHLTPLSDFQALVVYGFDGKGLKMPFLPKACDMQPGVDYWLPVTISLKEVTVA